jgi:hypothetical protein
VENKRIYFIMILSILLSTSSYAQKAADPSGNGGGTGGGTIEICIQQDADTMNCVSIPHFAGEVEKVAENYVNSYYPGKAWFIMSDDSL